MCLDPFQPYGLEHLRSFKTVLRADTGQTALLIPQHILVLEQEGY